MYVPESFAAFYICEMILPANVVRIKPSRTKQGLQYVELQYKLKQRDIKSHIVIISVRKKLNLAMSRELLSWYFCYVS